MSANLSIQLHVASFNNHCDAVDTLIRAGADIETGEGEAGTPLHLAALRGNCAVMRLLMEKEANVNALSKTIGPVINAAIRSGTVEAVQLIMSGAVHFDVDYITYDPPLSLSAGISEPSLFKDILTSGRAKWLQNVKLLDQALIAASYSGRLQSVCILLEFDHIYTNNTVQTAVLSAAIEKNWASVNELLDHAIKDTAVGNRRDVQLDDTFYFAATNREERLAILEKIWSFTNHSISQDILNFSLYQAANLNKHATVEWLLERCGADPNTSAERPQSIAHYASVASSSDFWNPLNAAASSGNIPIMKALIRKGAEVEGKRVYALQLAARDGHAEAVDILLKHGADVNKVLADSEELGFFSTTALQAACDNKRVGVVGALLKHDADPNLGGGAFTNPITAATQKSQPEILKLLLDAPDIEVNVVGGEDKSTPLINAATYMSIDSVELLVRRGAELDTQNAMGDTALIMASWKGDKDCVVLLCNEGADVTYRSPHRGLAIAAAADGLHPECATILADRMGGKIESYREQGKSKPDDVHVAISNFRSQNRPFQRATQRSACAAAITRTNHRRAQSRSH
jgi:ankyrin repeat protein